MADFIVFGDERIDPILASYYQDLDLITGFALDGRIPESSFKEDFTRTVLAALFLSFASAGSNLTVPGALGVINQANATALSSIAKLTQDIYDGRYSPREADQAREQRPEQTAEDGRAKLQNRLNLWVNKAGQMYNQGLIYQPPFYNFETGLLEEALFTWKLGQTEQHCKDCLEFTQLILPASAWRRLPPPQSPDLECGGWYCDCRYLRVFDRPETGLLPLGVGT